MRFVLPLGVFGLLVVLLGFGLTQDPKKVPSPLIGKPAPAFDLPLLHNQQVNFSPDDYKGKVWILNVWASWCVSCRAEHKVITKLANMKLVEIVGLNYKDEPQDGTRWLQQFGDPYAHSVLDYEGRAGIDWGVYGVPETFVIDGEGRIRYKHIGVLTEDDVQGTILPLIERLRQ